MAYLNSSAPSHIGSSFNNFVTNAFKSIRATFASIGQAMVAGTIAQRRFDQVEILQAKSDAELAKLNIKRDDIVQHVFRDMFWV